MDNVLLDFRHWFGWAISTFSVILVLYFFGFNLFKNYFLMFIILITLVIVDYFKHLTKLQ